MSNFYDDLVRIRKEKRLSKQDVYYKCRIPMETIEAIEDGSILAGKIRNITYLRSYFRTYAKSIGISVEDISTALDEHDAGLYNQGLLEKYLPQEAEKKDNAGDKTEDHAGDEPEGSTADRSGDETVDTARKADSGAGADASSGKKKTGETGKKGKVTGKSKIITPETQEKTVDDVDWEDKNLKKVRSTSTSELITSESRSKDRVTPARLPEQPEVAGVDWASKVKKAVYRPQRNRLLWVILATLLALALALASIVWYWQKDEADPVTSPAVESRSPAAPSRDPEPQAAPDPAAIEPVPQDVIATEEPEIEEEAVPAEVRTPLTREEIISQIAAASTTGDTLFVFAYALHGNLEPVRVQSDIFGDGDLQDISPRPYWVEHYQAMQFDFLDEIIFQGSLARMVLVFNGHIIDDFSDFYIDGSRIRLSRDLLMENETFETADTDPFTLLEPPRSLVERPRFSP